MNPRPAKKSGLLSGFSLRDWIWLGTLIAGLIANYAATTATLSTRLAAVEQTAMRIEARLWELATKRVATVPLPCPADAVRVSIPVSNALGGSEWPLRSVQSFSASPQ